MDLSLLKLPTWLPTTTHKLMALAEELFGSDSGVAKKAWVRTALLDAAKSFDIPEIPNFIENPAKAALVDLIIEIVWALHFRGPATGPIARAAQGV